jgi:uncharacterized protein
MKEIFKTILSDFHKKGIEKHKNRNINIPIDSTKIITLIGPRRSGKTYLLYQIMKKINTKIENIIYINFEDDRLNIKKENLDDIINAYFELYQKKDTSKLYFFLDEIQNVQGWEQFIRRIYDTITKNIYITGSSSKLLSKEIATSLRGRSIPYEIYPLSFKEFLNFKEINTTQIYSTIDKAQIKQEFNKYMTIGGFPETIFFDETLRLKTHQTYAELILYKDIIERYKLIEISKLKYFLKKSTSNISKEFSINKTYNEFKSQNITISKDTLYEFPKYFEDSYFIFYLNKYSESLIKQEFSSKKIYLIDTGLANSISFKTSEDKGRLLENIVFIELKRKNQNIYYHKNKHECDFIIEEKQQITQAIQVTKSLENQKTKKREIEGLIEAMETYNLKEGIILTEDEETELELNNKKIKIIPIWKWTLK